MASVSVTRRQWARSSDRRERLLDVADGLVGASGVAALNVEALAEAAGVSRSLAYVHFPNRTSLVMALLDRSEARADEQARRELRAATTFEDKVRAGAKAYFDSVERRGQGFLELLTDASLGAEVDQRRRARQAQAAAYWTREAEEAYGLPRRVARLAASVLVGTIEAAAEHWVRTGLPRALVEETHVDITLGALERLRARHGAQ